MNLFAFPFLADENIHPDVVAYLRDQGFNMASVVEEGLSGESDTTILQFAQQAGRVVLTHDSDFGALALARRQSFVGILYLRPGHIQPEFTLATLEALQRQEINVTPSFIVVATRQQSVVRIRIRQL